MKSLAYQDGIHLPSAESRVSSGQRRVFQGHASAHRDINRGHDDPRCVREKSARQQTGSVTAEQ